MAKGQIKPKKSKIDKDQFEKMCQIQATLQEIAGMYNCSEDTIQDWVNETYGENFSAVYKKKSAGGKMSLRRAMFQSALKGDRAMMIWLSKQHLGMREPIAKDIDDLEIEDISKTASDIYGN